MIPIYDAKDKTGWQARIERKAEENAGISRKVKEIIACVRRDGDAALLELTKKFDGVDLSEAGLMVSEKEYDKAAASVSAETLNLLKKAAKNIREYHSLQVREGFETSGAGYSLKQLVRPLKRVGIYVPGGKAAYPSTVLMSAVPAKVAGVSEIVMATPPDKNGKIAPIVLAAARIAGVDRVYKIGGAQAIAALAYGTQSVPAVDKIVGPGNAYVAQAKREVFGQTGIDMIAGPSEILIIADEFAEPSYVAADMLSQAEHDEMAAAILVTTSRDLAEKTAVELKKQYGTLPKAKTAAKALHSYGMAVIGETLADCAEIANIIAPEHLEIMTIEPESLLPLIENAGSIFLGAYSPEPLGDYMAGPNHILPTGGTARFSSPLSVDDFIKKSSVIKYTQSKLSEVCGDIVQFAREEGLEAHARAARIRFYKE
ncbi:MAG: histidinol dehydrogenase [Bacillota bacterium]|nr:histidinol dehydrogenase [Bacillota bacterium]